MRVVFNFTAMFEFNIITLFPSVFKDYFNTSIIKRAQEKKIIRIKIFNLRDFALDKHKTVDDKPYGGGAGMILKVDVIYRAIKALGKIQKPKAKIILFTPRGKQFNQRLAERWSKLEKLILICGHYEGIDERVARFCDEQISVGPYILTGGELPAMIIVDAVTRLIPGVIKPESLQEESFSIKKSRESKTKTIGEYPQYTRPPVFIFKDRKGKIKKLKVPSVLLFGNHKKIAQWREKHLTKLKK